jgi:hypothetical protein
MMALPPNDMTKRNRRGITKKTTSQNVPGDASVQKTFLLSFQLSKMPQLPASFYYFGHASQLER